MNIIFFLVLLLLLLTSAFFSTSETALMAMNRLRLRYLVRKGDQRAIVAKYLLSKPDKLLGTVLIANNLVNVALASLTTYFVTIVFGRSEGWYTAASSTAVLVALILFGEMLPKIIAANNPEAIGLAVVRPIAFVSSVLSPIVKVAADLTTSLARLLGFRTEAGLFPHILTEEELKTLLTGEVDEGMAQEKREMLSSVFQIGDIQVKEVMIPRVEVTAVDINQPIDEILQTFISSGYSRIPVYRGQFDNMVGILYGKDLLPYLVQRDGRKPEAPVDLARLLQPPFFVPDTATVEKVLRQMQKLKVHMAIVVDEFGGVEGIVTLEDILEEIVGEIHDEHDLEHDLIREIEPGIYMVEGKATIRELNKRLGLELHEDPNYTTLAGFLLALTGRLLKEGEVVEFEDISFRVERVHRHRIVLVRVHVKQRPVSEPRVKEAQLEAG